MLIERPRDSRIAPRHADVMPLPSEETTPPVINTYDVIDRPVAGGNNKGLDQKHRVPRFDAFLQPLEIRAVVGIKTALNVNRTP
jgi:hypothetical protein